MASSAGSAADFDYVVVGSGLGGLTIASLLARDGARVAVLERHETVGGYGHSFTWPSRDGDFRFCAHLHYVWDCGEGGGVHDYLSRLGLADDVRFHRLDPDGFDRVVLPGYDYRIANGSYNNVRRLSKLFPKWTTALETYFATMQALYDQANKIPLDVRWSSAVANAWSLRSALRFRNWTLQAYFDHLGFPSALQAILSGQGGCYFLPPERVSLLAHAVVAGGYDAGAYYPERTFDWFVERIAAVVRDAPGCVVRVGAEVTALDVEGGRVVSARLASGERVRGTHFVSNADPALTVAMVGRSHFDTSFLRRTEFTYSASVFSLYLGVRDLDLAQGIGNRNIWLYPSLDINALYRRQLADEPPPDEPFLFITSPTQHTTRRELLAPAGHEQLVVLAAANYDWWARLQARSRTEYGRAKRDFANQMIAQVEARFVPGLRAHMSTRAVGSPTTNQRFVAAARGNCYGSELTPANVNLGRLSFKTPIPNLFLVGAAAGMPGFAGCVTTAMKVFDALARG